MPTDLVFRTDWYAQSTQARVLAVTEKGGIILDRTVFYATGGGQPGDRGHLSLKDGRHIPIATAVWDDPAKTIVAHVPAGHVPADHVPADGAPPPAVGDVVTAVLDWQPRLLRMRTHTCLHLLSVALAYPVTGGSVGDGEGRLDFDMADTLEKDAVQERLTALIAAHAMVSDRWITDAELDANPGLVKTMSVQPPRGSGRIRLVEIAGLDLQPCGGTHVRNTGEIGHVEITGIEKKGRLNRRVRIRLG
jgi:misacylated tRNA(Ala) deacylase